jgi:type IV secretion system protein VirD4
MVTGNGTASGQRQGGWNGGSIDPAWLDPQRLAGDEWQLRNESGSVAGIALGQRDGRTIASRTEGHCLSVVGTGGGVEHALLLPNLLHYEGSMMVVDLDGRLARMTAAVRRERLKQTVVVLDPFSVSGEMSGSYNPLAALDEASPTVVEDAALLAEAMIVDYTRDPHWSYGARTLLQAVMLWMLRLPLDEINPWTLAQTISGSSDRLRVAARMLGCSPQEALIKMLCESPALDGVVAGFGSTFAAMGERERASMFSTALFQILFLQSPILRQMLSTSGCDLADLKARPTTLYLCLPASRVATHGRWWRLMMKLALAEFERAPAPRIPVLLVLNDLGAIGRIDPLETAAAKLSDAGVRVWMLMQSLEQVQARYPTAWQTLIAQAGVTTFWNCVDPMTLEFLATRTGLSREELASRLATDTQQCLVLASGHAPVILQRLGTGDDLRAG